MKQYWNSFKIAIAMYSKIPVPQCEWTPENMRYAMCFFPWIGIAIGLLTVGWACLCRALAAGGHTFSGAFIAVVYVLIPVVISGGIHMDGFMDTSDALSSHQEKERKLEILKDSHAGAFAILCCVCYFLLYYGVYTQISFRSLPVIALSFILSRTLSSLAVVTFPLARGSGLVYTFSDGAQKKAVRNTMIVYLVLLAAGLTLAGGYLGIAGYAAALLVFAWYYRMAKRSFGGITGDLAGFFLQICELAVALVAVVVDICV